MPKEINSAELGSLIKQIRESQNLTQLQFATLLSTSQSAIARIESGEQNLTTESINKISQVLNKPIISIAPKSLDFQVTGGKKLSGSITTNCSKNGAMGLLCASLLNKGKTVLHGIPRIEEVTRILEVFDSIGVKNSWCGDNTLCICPPKELQLDKIDKVSASKTRTILMFLGPLIHMFDSFSLPHSQGCTLGKRTISPHLYGLEKFGVDIEVTDNSYNVTVKPINKDNVEIVMYEASDTGAELLLLAAARFSGTTIIKFASSNYMVQEVCYFLQKLGVEITGIGTHILTIKGKNIIKEDDVQYYNSEDPIESMMFLSAAICTDSQITIKRCPIDYLELELLKLEKMGFKYDRGATYKSKNGYTNLVDIVTYPSKSNLKALDDKIQCGPYPALNIDNLPFFVPIAAIANGQTLIHDWVYENRAIYFTELNRLGTSINLMDPHRVIIQGTNNFNFKSAQVVCPPALRPAMIILIAMLAADGVSILRNVYSIKRGYEEIAERLNSLGANIQVI
jgi:UDP-N-acetylglucosamine 1-carboxyvinyltransferase